MFLNNGEEIYFLSQGACKAACPLSSLFPLVAFMIPRGQCPDQVEAACIDYGSRVLTLVKTCYQ